MAFLVSPGVNTSEIDLTTSIPAEATTTGATVGFFNWGPANTVVQVSSETDLVAKFGKPDNNASVSFLSAANFLGYANDLRVVRVLGTNTTLDITTSNNAVSNSGLSVQIANEEDYFNNQYQTTNSNISFAARYPGAIGNSLKVSVCPSTAAFTGWEYAGLFDAAPNTSNYALAVSGSPVVKDELHLVVVDQDGIFSGVANTVLEKFSNLSKATDAKGDDGSTIYYKEVLYRNSKYIHWLGHPTTTSNTTNAWGQTLSTIDASGDTFNSPASNATYSLVNGADGSPKQSDVIAAIDLYANKEKYDISLMFMGSGLTTVNSSISFSAIANQYLLVADGRKDAVAFISPPYANAVTSTAKTTDIVNYRNGSALMATSYGVMDSGWKYQYDKYSDVYRWVPLNADIAGLCVRTDNQRDPWFSPAGVNRGQIRNLVKLSFNPTQGERDTLYKAGVNPVVSFPGEGTILFGDKTMQGRPSAFDRINVRRLFIVLEKAIARAARSSLFEFNDEFTRAQFVSLVEPFLRDVQGRRGIYDFRVVCDESNNTPQVIDANQFVGDIYIKPARSVNFIQLNFVAVRSGVSFDEIVGRF
jgi:phage tail sheath protein FI